MPLYLVTGGCGFIGSHLVDRLIKLGHHVRVLDDLSTGKRESLAPDAEFLEGSIGDPAMLDRAFKHVCGCFHLAAIASVHSSIIAWSATTGVNLAASVAVFERCAALGIPVVYASSAAVYGQPSRVPIAEDDPTKPISPYGVDKLAMELHARAGAICRGLRSFGLRFFNVYGERQDPASPYSGVISTFIARVRTVQPLTIHGDGSQTRDFVHVSDLVNGITRAVDATATDAPVCNLGLGEGCMIHDLAERINRLALAPVPIVHKEPRLGDITKSCANTDLAVRLLGWAPGVDLEEGLSRLLAAQR